LELGNVKSTLQANLITILIISVYKFLENTWKSGGINPGDFLLLHSDLKSIYRYAKRSKTEIGPEDVLDSLLTYLGPQGTLMLPVFNFEYCNGRPFSMLTTTSQMGALSEAGRLHPDAVRTGHPIYSFVVIGNKSQSFQGLENYSGYGHDSPFALLKNMNGKIGVLNLPDQKSMTFYHYVEESCKVDYRYHKEFIGWYEFMNGMQCEKAFSIFVRDLERGVKTDVNRMGEYLWEKKIYSGSKYGVGVGFRSAPAKEVFDMVSNMILNGKALDYLYSVH